MELKKTISNKIMIILIAIIVAIFAMGWILPIGIDKVTRLVTENTYLVHILYLHNLAF